jgi:spore coat protein H
MRNFPTYISLLFLLLLTTSCYRELELPVIDPTVGSLRVLAFNGIYACADASEELLLYHLSEDSIFDFSPKVNFGDYHKVLLNGQALVNGEDNQLPPISLNTPYPVVAQKGIQVDSFELFFTRLPVLQVITNEAIPDDYKVDSFMELQYSEQGTSSPTQLFSSPAGIEIRGQSAMRFEKSAFGIELWNNYYREDRKVSLLGMRKCEDWILDAMYIDDLRVRQKLSYDLWRKITSLPDQDLREGVVPGINLEYVEVFINNSYYGLYCLGEKMNEDVLGFSDHQEDVGGVIYKAWDYVDNSATFYKIHSEPGLSDIWDGWELIYPKKSIEWGPLYKFVTTVVEADDHEFTQKIPEMIDLQVAADYYLFLNLLKGVDNSGKNIFYAKYTKDAPFFIIPWDLDATWGRRFDKRNSAESGIQTNNLFKRLIALDVEGFNDMKTQSWAQYRQGAFHKDSIMAVVDQYYWKVRESGAMERELRRWPELEIDMEIEYTYIESWISSRLENLDREFLAN